MLEDEKEITYFGEFVLRYQPLVLQNMLVDSMNECLGYEALDRFMKYSEAKIQDFKQNHLNKKIQPLFMAKYYRENLLKDYDSIKSRVDINLAGLREEWLHAKETERARQEE